MMRRAILAAALSVVAIQAHAEPPWYPYAVSCGEWAETHICVGKAGCPSWQWETECVVRKVTPAAQFSTIKPRLDWCTRSLERQRYSRRLFANQGDPIGDMMACLYAD